MGALWAMICASKLGRSVAGVALTIGGLLALLAVMYRRGKHAQADEDKAKDAEAAQRTAQEAAEAVQRSADAVRATNDEISRMPDAGTQRVGDAAAGTAAGWLRDHANRDQAGS